MRSKFLVLAMLLMGMQFANAQNPVQIDKNFKNSRITVVKQSANNNASGLNGTPVRRERCGFSAYMQKIKANGFDEVAFESQLKNYVQQRLAGGRTAFTGIVTIPVIFHVVYRTGDALSTSSANLPAAMFQAQIDQLNADYSNASGSTYGVASDVRLRFCLALVDTMGRTLAEPGIDRINGSTRGWSNTNTMSEGTLMSYLDATVKPSSIWDPYSYFNVWTASMSTSGLLGYSTFPSFSTLQGLDNGETSGTAGCVIAWESVGSVDVPGNDATYGLGRTLTHEAGHFFGLRHIWGDDACGEDYCGDTPPQDDATSGCPATGTLNNCTPSGPKMFENYMDYTDDACVNTFTANQATRIQAAMDNSPRRFTLMASKACQARAGNAIQFGTAVTYATTETGAAGTCPNTRSYSFKIYLSNAATGAATVTFAPTGTATLNGDYSISPASVTYVEGETAAKTITITVNDDQVVEPAETIVIGYTISGSGVVAGPDKQTVSLTIIDDDIANTAINNVTPLKTLLNENFNASTNIPTGWTTQVFDDGSGFYTPNQWVVSANGGTGTSGNAAHITRTLSTKPNTYANTNISDAYLFTPLIDATGLRELTFSFKWRCLGEVGYDEGYIGYIPEGTAVSGENVIYFNAVYSGLAAATAANTATLGLPASLNNTRFRLVFNWFNDETIGTNPPFTVDDVSVTGKYFSVATTTDADTAFTHLSGQTVNYYSKTATSPAALRIIATIANPNQNLDCVAASVQSAGNNKIPLLTTSGSYFRTEKVIKLAPATANTTAAYSATFYFTTAELSTAWTAAEIPTLKILKVKEGVDIFGTITAADAVLVTPTFTDNAANGYYSYTGNFTGFSQFMLVSPTTTLPVSLMNFDALAKKNSIQLTWNTSIELNNKGFVIERSTNGNSFQSIGWVNGKINSDVLSNYTFNDNFIQPNTVYYYRIRQVDIDSREVISSVRQARVNASGIAVNISPVPAKGKLNVYLSGTNNRADILLINAQGQLVKTWKQVNANGTTTGLNLENVPAGIYVLNIVLPEEKLVHKIVIE